jgi:hypothetical protein
LRITVGAIIAVTLVIFSLGCCDVICPPPEPPATHSLALGIATDKCPVPDATCVCPVPTSFRVKRGDTVHLVNTSPYEVQIVPSDAATFVEGTPIIIPAKKAVAVTVASTAPSPGVSLDMIVAAPGTLCPGLPGPRMDIDD